jgi:DNA-binding response OmpR family regulator
MRLLLVEDDAILGDGIRAGLRQAEFAVDWVRDGAAAKAALAAEPYEVVILDLGLPDLSGIALLQWLREQGADVPVLILTAYDSVGDRIRGLDAGADDYVSKPFDLGELGARVRALGRRRTARRGAVLTHGALALDITARSVTVGSAPIELTRREFEVLRVLLENRGRVLSRTQIEQALYAWGEELESNAVEVHVHHLRRKLDSGLIRTVRGIGYVIDASP